MFRYRVFSSLVSSLSAFFISSFFIIVISSFSSSSIIVILFLRLRRCLIISPPHYFLASSLDISFLSFSLSFHYFFFRLFAIICFRCRLRHFAVFRLQFARIIIGSSSPMVCLSGFSRSLLPFSTPIRLIAAEIAAFRPLTSFLAFAHWWLTPDIDIIDAFVIISYLFTLVITSFILATSFSHYRVISRRRLFVYFHCSCYITTPITFDTFQIYWAGWSWWILYSLPDI